MAIATAMMSGRKRLIVIVGATGSGKTDLSIAIAEHLSAPIISTDSRQFYRGMAIGTAQPSREQMARVEHHLVNCLDVNEEFNCGAYERVALECLDIFVHSLLYECAMFIKGSFLWRWLKEKH